MQDQWLQVIPEAEQPNGRIFLSGVSIHCPGTDLGLLPLIVDSNIWFYDLIHGENFGML